MRQELLSPRFVGERFLKHTIPLELLRDISVFEEFIIAVAKWKYVEEHDRVRAPKGFSEHLSIHLESVGAGSAIPRIVIENAIPAGELFPVADTDYFVKAVDLIASAVDAAERGLSGAITDFLSPTLLGYFDKLGRGLREGETLELRPESEQPARLTKASRRKLLLASENVELTEEVTLRGGVHGVDQARMTFELTLAGGKKVEARMDQLHLDTVLEATKGFMKGLKASVTGIGRYDRADKLQSVDQIEDIVIIDMADPLARIDELRLLKPGWLDGRGEVPTPDQFSWLEGFFSHGYPSSLAAPLIFPTAEGGVQLEWTLGAAEITLEVDLSSKQGELHSYDFSSEEEVFKPIDMGDPAGREELHAFIKDAMTGGENELSN